MKKFLLSFLLIITFAVYVSYVKFQSNDVANVISPSPVPVPVSQSTLKTALKDGEFTGDLTDAYYGNVQVKVIVQSGKIADVQFLDYPHDRNTSVRINQQAMPDLKQEVIQAQSATVDIVSGATATSDAFIKSLQSALDRAKA